MKKKILMVTPTFLPMSGGTENTIKEIAIRLSRKNYEIEIFSLRTPKFSGKKKEYLGEIKIKRFRWFPTKPMRFFSQNIILFLTFLAMKKKPLLIHQFHPIGFGWGCIFIKKLFKVPVVTSLMGWDTYDPLISLPPIGVRSIRWTMNNSDFITAPSVNLSFHAKKQGCKKTIQIIPHGTKYPVGGCKKRTLEGPPRKFIAVQRLHPRKKIPVLIQAVSFVVREFKDFVLLICGTGEDFYNLEEAIKKNDLEANVKLLGFVQEKELYDLYCSSDIFIMHSLYEAFGLVLVEAFACGLPVIATNVGAIPEVVPNECGILVPPNNPKMMAKAILELINNPEKFQRMKQNAIDYAKNFTWDKITEEYNSIYKHF